MTNGPRRLLVVSFFYPPDPAVGGRRIAKFVQYLPESGWSPTVLTARSGPSDPTALEHRNVHATRWVTPWRAQAQNRGQPEPGASLRQRLARGPIGRAAYRAIRHVLPMSSVRMPDATMGWIPFAVAEGRRLLESGSFDAILSSSGPPSSHIVASRLQRRSGLPWIADYRDPWSGNHWDRRIAPFAWLERRLERRVLRDVTALTTVSPGWARDLAELHRRPATVVHNGYDRADYPDRRTPEARFVLLYVGTLYWPGQDPEPLFAALARLAGRSQRALEAVGFELRFLGTSPGAAADLARRHGVGRWVRWLPPVDYTRSLALQTNATALLYLGWTEPSEGLLTAKIFEYIGAGRPILAIGPSDGPASELLRELGAPGLIVAPDAVADRLGSWVEEFRRSGDLAATWDREAAARYTRRAQTRRLAEVLDRAARG